MMHDSPLTHPDERSLMVVSKDVEYCVLYDGTDIPSLLEQLLTMGSSSPTTLDEAAHLDEEELTQEHFRAIVKELLSRSHGALC
jgi:hypothetical protein